MESTELNTEWSRGWVGIFIVIDCIAQERLRVFVSCWVGLFGPDDTLRILPFSDNYDNHTARRQCFATVIESC